MLQSSSTEILTGGRWFRGDKDVTENIFKIWKLANRNEFKQSDWFKNNHIQRWVKESGEWELKDIPTYIWTQQSPNTKFPEGKAFTVSGGTQPVPSFAYKKRIVRDSLLSDPTIKLKSEIALDEFTGLPKPKPGLFRDESYFGQGENGLETYEREALDGLLGVYKKSQEKYVRGRRMGYRIPTIEQEYSAGVDNRMYDKKNIKEHIIRTFSTTVQDVEEGEGITQLADTFNFLLFCSKLVIIFCQVKIITCKRHGSGLHYILPLYNYGS